MSNPDSSKKRKLHVATQDDSVVDTLTPSDAVFVATSAVTAIAVLTDTILFSGHRDGTIRRWNMTNTTTSSTATTKAEAASMSINSQQVQQQQPSQPDWIITSACVDLTNHETYGIDEKLGIAGLVIRKDQQCSNSNDTDDIDGNDNNTLSTTATHFLYSYNHQREDMRLDINGIPQKVMIWNAMSGERLYALMIDVGRCSRTGMFANPLISCLVFCKLLVDVVASSPTTTTTTRNSDGDDDQPANVEKEWTDAIVVALQATCDAPNSSENDINRVVTDTRVQSSNNTTTTTTVNGAPPPPPPPPPMKVVPAATTGNIVPFYEHTRKRMVPWSVVGGGFVRAMVAATATDNTGNIITVTETTTTSSSSIVSQQQPTPTTSTAQLSSDSVNADTSTAVKVKSEKVSSDRIDGGQANCILIWDASSPGTILFQFSLCAPNIVYSTPQRRFDGTVHALTLSNCNQFLLLSMANHANDDDDENDGVGNSVHVVMRLPVVVGGGQRSPQNDPADVVSIAGWYTSLRWEKVTSQRGDWIATLSRKKGFDSSHSVDELNLFSFRELVTAVESHTDTSIRDLEVQKLQETRSYTIPLTTDVEPTTLSIGQFHVITGYENGAVQLLRLFNDDDDSITTTIPGIMAGSNEYVSCSTAPIGLRGVPCPHLSSAANNVNLQNKCTVM